MAIALGEDFRLMVEIAGTPTLVGGIDTFDDSSEANVTTYNYFGAGTPLGVPDPRALTITASGALDPADAGQNALRTHRTDRTVATIHVLHDGTNGYELDVLVTGGGRGASAAGGPQTTTWAFAAQGDPVIVGTGPLP